MPWSEHELSALLRERGVAFDILHAQRETRTVEAAARELGVAPDAIVKSLLFADRDAPERFVLVLARGLTRVDRERLAKHLPGRWRFASAEECSRVTGYEAGTVPPVGHATAFPVVMDARVRSMATLIGGGGGHLASLRLARPDVERLTGCSVADVAVEPPA